jgi:hypothetical protein
MKGRYWNVYRIIGGTAMLFVVWVVMVSHFAYGNGGNSNPAVHPPNAKFRGLSYQDLEARFWQTLFAIPVVDGNHPLFSGGPVDAGDGIVLLPAPFAIPGNPVQIEATIPLGSALFIPIVNTECSAFEPDPFHGDNETDQRAQANAWMDGAYGLEATIDGKLVKNIDAYRFQSAQFVWGPLPEDNLFEFLGFDAPEGTTSTAVDAGFYLLITPLSVGEHEIHIGGALDPFTPDDPSDDSIIDATFIITVAKNK